MPVKNHFPRFYKLKTGAYSYVWTDKCEKLLPKHYKERCLEYMTGEPKPIHWRPDPRKYRVDEYGTRHQVQNHPILVKYPMQCNKGLWAGEGIVQCFLRKVKSHKYQDLMTPRVPKFYTPMLSERLLFSEILNKWYKIPCTNRAMDLIDDAFGLDYYILQTSERDLNSKLGMDLKRLMLLKLCDDAEITLTPEREQIFLRYKKFMVERDIAEWVGLSITEALEKAESELEQVKKRPLKSLIAAKFQADLEEARKAGIGVDELAKQPTTQDTPQSETGEEKPATGKVTQFTKGVGSGLQNIARMVSNIGSKEKREDKEARK